MADARETLCAAGLLRECIGRPARLSFFDSLFADRLGRVLGTLVAVEPGALTVECLDVPPDNQAGTRVTLELVKGGRFLWCHTRVHGPSPLSLHHLRLAWPETIQTVQRRGFPRVDTHVPVHYATPRMPAPLQGVLLNVSAGGAAIEGPGQLAPGDVVFLAFALGSGLFFQDISADVLRVQPTRSGWWTAGLRFRDISPQQQAALARWVRQHHQNPTEQGLNP